MNAIPDDVLTVAAVVTGDDRTRLVGWQRVAAIAAMTALGHSSRHIAWALHTTQTSIYQTATRNGLRIHQHDQRPDWTAIDMVVTGAARLHLTGNDRVEAVRLMAEHHTSIDRARLAADEITRIARNLGVTLRQPDPWNWYAYLGRQNKRQAVAA